MERKNKEKGRIGYKIAAVILAVITWLAVANISDYQTTREISDIPVTQINGDVLEELDQVYDVASGDTVDIVVKGRRSVVETLNEDDFSAVADLSTMSITNTVSVSVTANDESVQDEVSITCVDNTMKLNLEDKITQQFAVKVETTGETKDGYAVSATSSTPNIVKIEGPKSAVEKITEVRASVSVQDRKANFETEAELKIYDAYGEEINNDKIKLDTQTTKVSVSVYATKEVPVEVSLRGTPGDGYGVEGVAFQPSTVTIVGPADALATVEKIAIDDISVSGMTEDFQSDVDIRDYLPDDVTVVDMAPEITVNISVSEIAEKSLTVTQSNLTLNNRNEDYTYEITLTDLTIKLSGFADDISDITIGDLAPVIDCSGLSVGNHSNVTVSLTAIDGVTAEITGSVSVTVTSIER